jgi:hypothetical protein
VRRELELLFHASKNGCRVEALQLSAVERIERALTLCLIVAWRIARWMRLGLTCLDLEATLLLERDEWAAAYLLSKKQPPRAVAERGDSTYRATRWISRSQER